MLKIYDIPTAQKTILKRTPLTLTDYPPNLVASVEEIFGIGVTLPEAVTRILESVRPDGDAALKK